MGYKVAVIVEARRERHRGHRVNVKALETRPDGPVPWLSSSWSSCPSSCSWSYAASLCMAHTPIGGEFMLL